MFAYKSNLTLVSYKQKASKVIYLISTKQEVRTDPSATDKTSGVAGTPDIVDYYKQNKLGVKVSEVLQRKYSVSRLSNRWSLTVFFFLLNMTGVNAAIIAKENKRVKQDRMVRKEFLYSLGKSLVSDYCKRRVYSQTIPTGIVNRIFQVFSFPRKRREQNGHNGYEICSYCPVRKCRKTKKVCKECDTLICGEHTVTICSFCFPKYKMVEKEG